MLAPAPLSRGGGAFGIAERRSSEPGLPLFSLATSHSFDQRRQRRRFSHLSLRRVPSSALKSNHG